MTGNPENLIDLKKEKPVFFYKKIFGVLVLFMGMNTINAYGVCGNNIIEGKEECDNLNFGRENCQTQGYDSGSLECIQKICKISTDNCKNEDDPENIVSTIHSKNYAVVPYIAGKVEKGKDVKV